MKSISCKVLLVVVCIFVFSCGGGGKKNEGVIPEVDSNTELKADETIEQEEIEEEGPEEAELEIEETEETVVKEEELDILPASGNSYIAPYDPEMVVKDEGISIVVNQIIMILVEDNREDIANELATKINGSIVGFVPTPDTYQIELKSSSIDELENALSVLRSDIRVEAAIKSIISSANESSDIENILTGNLEGDVWAYKRIKIIEAWKAINNAKITLDTNIKVAILDSGLDRFHSEFKDINVKGENVVPDGPLSYYDDHGHGTKVAGIIAAANNGEGMNGILTGLRNDSFELHVYKICDKEENFSDIAKRLGLENAVENGARVVNLSFGTDPNFAVYYLSHYEDWQEAKKYYKKILSKYPNTLFVAAVGNDNMDAAFHFPSSTPVPNIISVAATDKDDKRSIWNLSLPFLSPKKASNYGDNVHIAAPGTHIWTTRSSADAYALTDGNYKYDNGTSMSAPFVTGVAALLFQIDPFLTPVEVKSILIDTADEVETDKGTWKRLNALNAVNFVINRLKSANPEPISEQPVIEPQLLPLSDDIEPDTDPDPEPVIIPPPPVNHPPVVSNVVLSGTGIYDGGTGDVTVTYTLADADGDTCDITVEYKNEMAANPEWRSATTVEKTFSVAPGNRSVTWQSGVDVPYFGGYRIRVTPTDTGTSTAGISDWFEINNNPPPPPNTPPTAKIKEPIDGSIFYKGTNEIFFDGGGTDKEDGITWSATWTSNIDGEIKNYICYHPNGNFSDYDCVLSYGVHVITLTVYDSGGLSDSDSITITVSDRCEAFLIKEDDKLYYCRNNKAYPTDADTVKIMADAELFGWTTYKDDSASNYMEGPEFVSDGVLLREIGTDPVYLLMDNKLRWIRTVEALNWMNGILGEINYEDDIIDVPPVIFAKYEHGSDIFEVRFTEAYERNLGPIEESRFCCDWKAWPGSYVSVILGFPVTEVENALQSGYSGISGTYQTFDKGAIDSSEKGAFAVYGAIYQKYKELGYSSSKLGFPISDEYGWPDGKGNTHRRSDFEGGYIYWVSSVDETYVVYDTTSDNVEITFVDSDLETAVRNVLGADTGPITTDMVREVTSLDIRGDVCMINDITGLEYFVNLEKLNLSGQTGLTNVSPLANLINLIELLLSETGVIDLTPLSNLYNLKEMYLYSTNVSDLGPLSDLSNLRRLSIQSNNITDVSPLAGLIRLEGLIIMGYLTISPQGYVTRGSLADISPLSNLINLTCLDVTGNVISDISVLVNILDDGDKLFIQVNSLDTGDCPDIQTLVDKGVVVHSDVNCQ